jgi:hypothetical protein
MKAPAYPEQRCSTRRARCQMGRRAPCRTEFGVLSRAHFGIWFDSDRFERFRKYAAPPRCPKTTSAPASLARPNRSPSHYDREGDRFGLEWKTSIETCEARRQRNERRRFEGKELSEL